jgi:hypothetical protein
LDFFKKDYKVYSAEEIINNFPKLKEDFSKMIVTDFTFYSKEIVSYLKKNNVKLTKKQSGNLFSYATTIPKEAAAGLWSDLRKECPQESAKWYQSDPVITAYIRDLLNKDAV